MCLMAALREVFGGDTLSETGFGAISRPRQPKQGIPGVEGARDAPARFWQALAKMAGLILVLRVCFHTYYKKRNLKIVLFRIARISLNLFSSLFVFLLVLFEKK